MKGSKKTIKNTIPQVIKSYFNDITHLFVLCIVLNKQLSNKLPKDTSQKVRLIPPAELCCKPIPVVHLILCFKNTRQFYYLYDIVFVHMGELVFKAA